MGVDPALKVALHQLRAVRSQRPADAAGPCVFAGWRDGMADVLDALAEVLPFEEDRVRARMEADAARVAAAELRASARTSHDS
ncbi:hypothetical protein F6X68_08920 [Micromonospora sp. AMSO12t]|uniref:hypothetical protein n=1 Tax=Micromonospora sp. AMSO12t TaxID=2650410 RepID=UPI00124B792C|nr:hypothetical protein [Micromonospora sp. AMSO12t]KAB1159200.1 hypothetical protein F6X68_08920 [Micromonospora sp. AMSO12t]